MGARSSIPGLRGRDFASSLRGENTDYDPYWDQVKLLLPFDGPNTTTGFPDLKGHAFSVSGTVANKNDAAPFGSTSAYFTASCISTPDHADWTIGTNDMTVDFWMKAPGTSAYEQIFGQRNGDGSGGACPFGVTRDNATNKMLCNYVNNAGSFVSVSGTAVVWDNNWHHIAIERFGTQFNQFVDGVLDAQQTLAGGFSFNEGTSVLAVGGHGAYLSGRYTGWLKDFRFTIGAARYKGQPFRPRRLAVPHCGLSDLS